MQVTGILRRAPRARLIVLTVGVTVGLVCGGAFASASSPDNNGMFTACYKTGGTKPGGLRLIDPSASSSVTPYASQCASGEVQVTWNSGMNERGPWDSASNFTKGDVVQAGGASYVALVNNSGVSPTNAPATWASLATQGPQGPQGAQGPQGVPGPNAITDVTSLDSGGGQTILATSQAFYGTPVAITMPGAATGTPPTAVWGTVSASLGAHAAVPGLYHFKYALCYSPTSPTTGFTPFNGNWLDGYLSSTPAVFTASEAEINTRVFPGTVYFGMCVQNASTIPSVNIDFNGVVSGFVAIEP
jgi:hypothetical protein